MIAPAGFDHRHLHAHGTSAIHRLAGETKLAGLFAFVLVVALTPGRWLLAFGIDAAIVSAVIAIARLPVRLVLLRLAAVTPFVAFAFLLPFVGDGPRTDVLGVAVSSDGLWAAAAILSKALLGASAGIIVTATTSITDIMSGLSRLRMPKPLVAIMAFMFRYLDLVVDQLTRMRRAMVARAHDPRWLWQARPIAASAGSLFVRTYERGERIHGAMAARGFTGVMPELRSSKPAPREWLICLVPALLACAAAVSARAAGLT